MSSPVSREQHWSASRFMLFEQCPQAFKARYVDGEVSDPSLPMLFGSAVHLALEALHQGHRQARPVSVRNKDAQDQQVGPDHTGYELVHSPAEGHYLAARAVYSEQFDRMQGLLREMGAQAPGGLYAAGLVAIDQVANLELNADGHSEAERWFTLPTPKWGMITVGAVDLWSPPWSAHGPTVWDFKTTIGKWGPDRVQRETWQPMLYTWAYQRVYGVVPTFMYVVLNRLERTIDIMQRSWSAAEWSDDMGLLAARALAISEAVADGDFSCNRGHGRCLQCGETYGHDHVCDGGRRPTTIKLTRQKTVNGVTWDQPSFDQV